MACQLQGALSRAVRSQSTRIAARAQDIEILDTPTAFYNHLLDGVANAKQSISITALYLGTGPKEEALVEEIRSACHRNPDLTVNFLFDHSRGTRGGAKSTAALLQPLAEAFPSRVHARFLRMPQLRTRLAACMPARYNEGIAVQHMKAYVFDDTTLLSGANLSDDYFTDRQDRYWVFRRNPTLATAVTAVMDAVAPFAAVVRQNAWTPRAESPQAQRADSETEQGLRSALQNSLRTAADTDTDTDTDTELHLALNCGPLQLHNDAAITTAVLGAAVAAGADVHLATGYLNPASSLREAVIGQGGAGRVSIATAEPRANGFYSESGGHPSGAVPLGYSLIARDFLRACLHAGQGHRVGLREWYREGWTFHAKGMWVAPPGAPGGEVSLATIGSPNFGRRSFERDLELQMYVTSDSQDLRRRMAEERDRLFADTDELTLETFKHPSRRVRWNGGWTHGVWVEGARRILGPLL